MHAKCRCVHFHQCVCSEICSRPSGLFPGRDQRAVSQANELITVRFGRRGARRSLYCRDSSTLLIKASVLAKLRNPWVGFWPQQLLAIVAGCPDL